jgi:iron complex outermembrane recepter protein
MHIRKKSVCAVAQIFGGLALVGFGGVAIAQQAQDTQQLQRVEITGSSIKRIQAEGALPVQVLLKEDIEKSGAKSTADLVQKLPAMQGFTQESVSVGGGGAGFSGASLHNLGETRTLVLLNGRRIASFAGQALTGALAGFDLNTIPLAAIERVEVLADGASALYGSDAIGGVINFILKRDFQGLEVSGGLTFPSAGGARENRLSAVLGFGDPNKDRYNVFVAASHDSRTPLKATDRSFAKTGRVKFDFQGKQYEFTNDSFRGVPGNATPFNADWVRNTYFLQNGKCPSQHFETSDGLGGTYCRFDYTSELQIYPETSKDSALISGSLKFSDNHTGFVDLVYARNKTISRIAPPPVDITIAQGSVFYNQYAPILGAVPSDGDLFVGWRGADFGKRTTDDRSNATHITFGLAGTLGSWDYNTSFVHSENKWNEYYRDGWISRNGLLAALDSGTINPFVGVGQQTPAAVQAIAGAKATGLFQSGKSTLDMIQVRGSTEVAKLDAGPVSLGTGGDVRKEKNKFTPGLYAAGVIDGIAGDDSQSVPFDVSRKVAGIFGELNVPITKQLEATGSVRYDHYSDFGNAATYKAQARYQPTKSVLFRGSLGTGFRAPSVPQISGPAKQLFGVTGNNYTCPFPATDPLGAICPPRKIQYNQYAGANPNLKPEKSNQWTLGFRIEPSEEFSLGMDLWSVQIKNQIGQKTEDTVFASPEFYRNNFTSYFDPVSKRTLLALFLPNENLGKAKYRGVDIDTKVRFNTPIGKLNSAVLATYMIQHEYERFPGSGLFSDLGIYNDSAVTFRWQGRVINTLDTGAFSHTLTMNYKSGYVDQPQEVTNVATGDAETITRNVSGYTTFDWQTRWTISKGLKLSGGVLNLLNTNPPLSIKSQGGQQIGYDNRYTDPRGRTYYVDLSYGF